MTRQFRGMVLKIGGLRLPTTCEKGVEGRGTSKQVFCFPPACATGLCVFKWPYTTNKNKGAAQFCNSRSTLTQSSHVWAWRSQRQATGGSFFFDEARLLIYNSTSGCLGYRIEICLQSNDTQSSIIPVSRQKCVQSRAPTFSKWS